MRPAGNGLPSQASTIPIFPSEITTKGTFSTVYCQGQRPMCKPGASVSACKPASPLRAMMRPAGSSLLLPNRTNFFVTYPILSLGIIITPNSHRIAFQPTTARINGTIHQYDNTFRNNDSTSLPLYLIEIRTKIKTHK